MNISEMHTAFRTIGQQMGMQLIRGILPESIDTYLNSAINEKVRSVVIMNASTVFRDRVAIQDNSISPINSIRTLVTKGSLPIGSIVTDDEYYSIDVSGINNVMYYTSFRVKYVNDKKRRGTRFIENDKLDDTRSDYCNRESWDYPVVTMNVDVSNKEIVDLYIGETTKTPEKLELGYIKNPKIVKYSANSGSAVSCDLPVYLHDEIVQMAVEKFFKSIGATTKPVTRN